MATKGENSVMRWVGTSPWSTGWGKRADLDGQCIFSPLPTLRQIPLRCSSAGL